MLFTCTIFTCQQTVCYSLLFHSNAKNTLLSLSEGHSFILVSKQNGHPDPNAGDYSKEIKSLVLKNLCFSSQISAISDTIKEPLSWQRKAA